MHNGRGDAQKSAKYSEQEAIPDQEVKDATCTKCGAWRGELGLEPNFHMFIDHLMQIFDEIKRVLKPTGTCWVNLGDTYSGSGGNNSNCSYSRKGSGGSGLMGDNVFARLKKRAGFATRSFDMSGVPGKSLCLIPERFATAMIEHQWILRNKIVWNKPNVMPSSIKDRFTGSHEYVFFFTKSRKYYFETQYEPYQSTPKQIAQYMKFDYEGQALKDYDSVGVQDPSDVKRRIIANMRGKFGGNKATGYGNPRYSGEPWVPQSELGRIIRDVWSISTQSYEEAHFATYPEKLVETPIKAGVPANGTVIDPFCGSRTTGLVAMKLARDFIGMDVSSEYLELAKKRLEPYLNQERLF